MHVDAVTDGKQTEYIHGAGQTLARITNDTDITYLHNDHLGTPIMGTDAAGNQLWREEYTPFAEKYTSNAANDDLAGGIGGYYASGSFSRARMGALAGAAVGAINVFSSNAAGMVAGGALANIAGQTAPQVGNNVKNGARTLGGALENVKIDTVTAVSAAAGADIGGVVGKAISGAIPKTSRAVVGNTFKASNPSSALGNATEAAVEGAIAGSVEKSGTESTAVSDVVEAASEIAADAVETITDL